MFEGLGLDGSSAKWIVPLVFSFAGGTASLLFQPVFAKFNQRLSFSGRAWERVQNRRLDAFEALLELSKELRKTSPTGNHEDGLVETKSPHLSDDKAFEDFLQFFHNSHSIMDDWIDHSTSQHIRYMNDYLHNLKIAYMTTSEGLKEQLAVTVKNDLVNLGSQTNRVAHKFFANIDKRNLGFHGNGKFPVKQTIRKLDETNLNKWMITHDLLLKPGQPAPYWSQDNT